MFAWCNMQFIFHWRIFSLSRYRIGKIRRPLIPRKYSCFIYRICKVTGNSNVLSKIEFLSRQLIFQSASVSLFLSLFASQRRLIQFGYGMQGKHFRISLYLALSPFWITHWMNCCAWLCLICGVFLVVIESIHFCSRGSAHLLALRSEVLGI